MSRRWAQNFLQFPLERGFNDDHMRDIPRPYLEYTINQTFKTTEWGMLVGGWLAPYTWHYFDPTVKWRQVVRKCAKYGCIGGILLGPVYTYARIKFYKYDRQQLYERCYLARYDKRQLFVDRTFALGLAVGLLYDGWLAAPGFANFCFLMCHFYNYFLWDKLPRVFRDQMEEPPSYSNAPRKL